MYIGYYITLCFCEKGAKKPPAPKALVLQGYDADGFKMLMVNIVYVCRYALFAAALPAGLRVRRAGRTS